MSISCRSSQQKCVGRAVWKSLRRANTEGVRALGGTMQRVESAGVDGKKERERGLRRSCVRGGVEKAQERKQAWRQIQLNNEEE